MRFFQDERYPRLAQAHHESFVRAEPFPHVVMDDFLPEEVCERLIEQFPAPGSIDWQRIDSKDQKKLAAARESLFSDYLCAVLREFNGPAALQFLETLTGIAGLIPDPYFEGGGVHQIVSGGFLKVHADFNYHRRLKLDRRLNLIVYLNKDWREEYNGHLELWDRGMTRCVRKVLPVFNRAVVFATTSWSYHGHPERLACPPPMTRKSLALYYYSNGRPADEKTDSHGVLWEERRRGWEAAGTYARLLRGCASVLEKPAKWMRRKANRLADSAAPPERH
jgi:Rps23 Pro-64 3,4-dihydroxylase Tpa1-like proline 4-hydroxylase